MRDYVHVTDLASAHLKALEKLTSDGKNLKLNLGTGSGYSVLEVIKSVERLSGRKVPAQDAPRRAGDPSGTRSRLGRPRSKHSAGS